MVIGADFINGSSDPKDYLAIVKALVKAGASVNYRNENGKRRCIGPQRADCRISLMENDLEVPRRIVKQLSGKGASGKIGTYSHTELSQMEKAMTQFWDRVSTEMTTTAVVKLT